MAHKRSHSETEHEDSPVRAGIYCCECGKKKEGAVAYSRCTHIDHIQINHDVCCKCVRMDGDEPMCIACSLLQTCAVCRKEYPTTILCPIDNKQICGDCFAPYSSMCNYHVTDPETFPDPQKVHQHTAMCVSCLEVMPATSFLACRFCTMSVCTKCIHASSGGCVKCIRKVPWM